MGDWKGTRLCTLDPFSCTNILILRIPEDSFVVLFLFERIPFIWASQSMLKWL